MSNWIKRLFNFTRLPLSESEMWEHGRCLGEPARRHKQQGNVQFKLWRQGDQKYVDGVGHTEDVWHDMNKYHWKFFNPLN